MNAVRHLERAVSLDPYSYSSLRSLARIHRIRGDNDKAGYNWHRCVIKDDNNKTEIYQNIVLSTSLGIMTKLDTNGLSAF